MDIKILPQKLEVAENEGSSATRDVDAESASRKTLFSSIFDREIREARESQRGNNSPEDDYPKEENTTKIDSGQVQGIANMLGEERVLDGGSKLILQGEEPSEDSLIQFAKTQGININFLNEPVLENSKVNSGDTLVKNKVAKEIGPNKRIGIATSLELKIQEKNRTENSFFSGNTNEKLMLKDVQIPVTKAELLNLAQQSKAFTQIKSIEATPKKDATLTADPTLVAANKPEASSRLINFGVQNWSLTDIEKRHEQYLEISRRLTESLGNRISTQIKRGAWRVEMDLHPKSLGRIEIQLEMRNGELEAHFNTSQSVTRELLQESFSKLKDILSQHGIDSAYIGLGSENGRNSDGNSTEGEKSDAYGSLTEADLDSETSKEPDSSISSGRLDVKV
ncbi:flagellar hook-length control protein FliK [Gammaproteobacteria bacterium]|nr:flagellar hook-length control protein FliK [Gammaproteobacteria bacterium]